MKRSLLRLLAKIDRAIAQEPVLGLVLLMLAAEVFAGLIFCFFWLVYLALKS